MLHSKLSGWFMILHQLFFLAHLWEKGLGSFRGRSVNLESGIVAFLHLFHPTLQESPGGCKPQMMGELGLIERKEFSAPNLHLVIGILLQRPKDNTSDCGPLELRMVLFKPPSVMLLDLGTDISFQRHTAPGLFTLFPNGVYTPCGFNCLKTNLSRYRRVKSWIVTWLMRPLNHPSEVFA